MPAKTDAPASLPTGALSPVSDASSTDEMPPTTTPSTAIRSPGRTTSRSPTAISSTAVSVSTPSRSRRARGGCSASSPATAEAARRLTRSSSQRPSVTKPTMISAVSKNTSRAAPALSNAPPAKAAAAL